MICLLLESEIPLAKVLPMNSIARRWKMITEKLFIACLDARKSSKISDVLLWCTSTISVITSLLIFPYNTPEDLAYTHSSKRGGII